MIKGLYAAATGMMALESRQDVIANNIVNAATPGFRRQYAVQKGFYDVFLGVMRSPIQFNTKDGPGGGLKLTETFTDLRAGPITSTGDPFNVALVGPGYIAVATGDGERFTRNGQLSIDVDGHLTTSEGLKVQDVNGGPISVSGGAVTISEDGGVSVDGTLAGRISLIEFEDPHMLNRVGNSLFAASPEALQRSSNASQTRVKQESLELSNVQLAVEMVNLTMGLRAYAANQKVINTMDETMSRLIERVGSPL